MFIILSSVVGFVAFFALFVLFSRAKRIQQSKVLGSVFYFGGASLLAGTGICTGNFELGLSAAFGWLLAPILVFVVWALSWRD